MTDFQGRQNLWNGNITPSEVTDSEAPWRNLGTSMSAISFGFIATAILISMFLIMAIFEHLVRQRPSFLLPRSGDRVPRNLTRHRNEMCMATKLGNLQNVLAPHPFDVSVLMPGQEYPTYIAQPAPLPCRREEISWPSHAHFHNNSQP